MSDKASSSKTETAPPTKITEPHKDDDHPAALGVLEEDDEFEEFPVAGVSLYPVQGACTVLMARRLGRLADRPRAPRRRRSRSSQVWRRQALGR